LDKLITRRMSVYPVLAFFREIPGLIAITRNLKFRRRSISDLGKHLRKRRLACLRFSTRPMTESELMFSSTTAWAGTEGRGGISRCRRTAKSAGVPEHTRGQPRRWRSLIERFRTDPRAEGRSIRR